MSVIASSMPIYQSLGSFAGEVDNPLAGGESGLRPVPPQIRSKWPTATRPVSRESA